MTPDFVSAAMSLSSFASLLVSMMARSTSKKSERVSIEIDRGVGFGYVSERESA